MAYGMNASAQSQIECKRAQERNHHEESIAAAAAAGILTIGMAVLPSAASASEVAPSTDGLAGSTAISGQID